MVEAATKNVKTTLSFLVAALSFIGWAFSLPSNLSLLKTSSELEAMVFPIPYVDLSLYEFLAIFSMSMTPFLCIGVIYVSRFRVFFQLFLYLTSLFLFQFNPFTRDAVSSINLTLQLYILAVSMFRIDEKSENIILKGFFNLLLIYLFCSAAVSKVADPAWMGAETLSILFKSQFFAGVFTSIDMPHGLLVMISWSIVVAQILIPIFLMSRFYVISVFLAVSFHLAVLVFLGLTNFSLSMTVIWYFVYREECLRISIEDLLKRGMAYVTYAIRS